MTIRNRLKSYIDGSSLSYARLGRALNCSSSALSQYINEKYEGDVNKLEKKIEQYLERSESRRYKMPELCYVETLISKKILEMCCYCHTTNALGLIAGFSGVGKTYTIKKYAKEHAGSVVLLEADYASNKTELFRSIAEGLGLNSESQFGRINRLLLQRLRDSNILIIIDEAENLNKEALDSLRRLRDKLDDSIGILLVGEHRLMVKIASDRKNFARMYNRIDRRLNLDRLDEKETKKFLEAVLPAGAAYSKTIFEKTKGITRTLVKLIKASILLAEVNESELNEDIIEGATETIVLEMY